MSEELNMNGRSSVESGDLRDLRDLVSSTRVPEGRKLEGRRATADRPLVAHIRECQMYHVGLQPVLICCKNYNQPNT